MKRNKSKGITLIVLVITIIVLLILSSVTISILIGKNGLLSETKSAKEKSKSASIEENTTLENYERNINKVINGTRDTINNNYSAEETEIGTWINGKKIYQKVININQSLPANTTSMTIPCEYIPVEDIIYTNCIYRVPYENSTVYATTVNRGFIIYNKKNDGTANLELKQEQTGGTAAYGVACIMQYTKTTD